MVVWTSECMPSHYCSNLSNHGDNLHSPLYTRQNHTIYTISVVYHVTCTGPAGCYHIRPGHSIVARHSVNVVKIDSVWSKAAEYTTTFSDFNAAQNSSWLTLLAAHLQWERGEGGWSCGLVTSGSLWETKDFRTITESRVSNPARVSR